MMADPMTKELGKTKHEKHVEAMGLCWIQEPPRQQARRSVGLWCSSPTPLAVRGWMMVS